MPNTKHFLKPDVKYIEPVFDVSYMCRIHYTSEIFNSVIPSEVILNHILIHQYATNIKARRDHLKVIHGIHRLGPIVIDERYQFVMFPVTVSQNKNPFYINLYSLVNFSETKDLAAPTRVHFSDNTTLDINADFKFCEKQYDKTLRVLDRSIKIKEHPELYITRTMHHEQYHSQRTVKL